MNYLAVQCELKAGIVFPNESVGVEISAEVEVSFGFVEICVASVVICSDPVVKVNMLRISRIETYCYFIMIFTAANSAIETEACQSVVESITTVVLMRTPHLDFVFSRAVVHLRAQMSR